jgi:ABC-type nitrate/sulfonate/bicarbonate transport system substrate-binding protein
VLQRYQALLDRKHAGTLLISPFEVQAEARGFTRLANATQVIGSYQGLVAGVRRSWAERNRDALVGYIRGYAQGVEWLYDPANRDAAIALFLQNVPNATPEIAATSYRVLLDPKEGFQRRARLDLEGVRTVLALRSKWAQEKKPLTDPMRYYDASYYDAAMRGWR